MGKRFSLSETTVASAKQQLGDLKQEVNPLQLLALGAVVAGSYYGHRHFQRLVDDRAILREKQLRLEFRKLGLSVIPVSDAADIADLWEQIAAIEQTDSPNADIRRQRFDRVNDDIGPDFYKDPQWLLLTTLGRSQTKPGHLVGITRYKITGDVDLTKLSDYSHGDIEKRTERSFGRTVVVEATAVTDKWSSHSGRFHILSPDVVTTAGYLGSLDLARRHNLTLLAIECHPPTMDYHSIVDRFKNRYLIGSDSNLTTQWRQLAVVARFGRGFDPNKLSPNYYPATDDLPGTSVGWMVLRDPLRDDLRVRHGYRLLSPSQNC